MFWIIINFISEIFNRISNNRKTYKCVAYIDKKEQDKVVDAFEITEYSLRRAYKTANEILKYKYPGLGIDLRMFNKTK